MPEVEIISAERGVVFDGRGTNLTRSTSASICLVWEEMGLTLYQGIAAT